MGVFCIVLTILKCIGAASLCSAIRESVGDHYPIIIRKLLLVPHFEHSFDKLTSCFFDVVNPTRILRLMNRHPLFLSAVIFASMLPLLHANEPLSDGNANLVWGPHNVSADAFDASFDVGTMDTEGEVWWRRWGLKTGYFESDVVDNNSGEGLDFANVDMKRRLLSATQNSFVALGLGWENIALGNVGEDDNTQGPRLLLEGRLGVTRLLHLYGYSAWLPSLKETGQLQDPSGFELAAGLSVKPIPHLSFRAGYRELRLDFKSLQGANESSKTQGVVLGAGIHW